MYERHFGLSDKPFRLTPDARFFYPSDQHRRALAFLEYGLHEGEGFIVITGEPGTGKSTLVSKLMAEHSRDPLKVASIETTRLTDEHLLEMLVSRFELKQPRLGGKASLVETLRKAFVAWEKRGTRALAIIDEAQNLPAETVEELRMLSNLTSNQRPLLQTFLIGQPGLRDRIEQPEFEQLRQRITASFHLGPFKAEEIRPYVEHRLIQAGWRGHPSFEDSAYEGIIEATGGVPRLINVLCDRLLLFCYLESSDQIDKDAVRTVAAETGIRAPAGAAGTAAAAVPEPAPIAAGQGDAVNANIGLALVSELNDRLRSIENRIQYTERRLHLELIRLRKLIVPLGATETAETDSGGAESATLHSRASN
ncbi:MAG: AAA family ATPase [Gammaproteobacteria bacterium]|nr:AAA family ATPase [Gammaproteobacteria bacterium]